MTGDTPAYRLHELPYQADPIPRLESVRALGAPVLLDSADRRNQLGRYSILCAGPLLQIIDDQPAAQVQQHLRAALQQLGPARWPGDLRLPFGAGLVGYLAYDYGRQLESLPCLARHDIALPDLSFGLYDWSVVSDHQLQRCWLVCHPQVPSAREQALLRQLDSNAAPRQAFSLCEPFAAEQGKAQYAEAFARVQDYIHAGDCYQINLAQRFSSRYQGDPLSAYCALRERSPTPFSAYLEMAGGTLLSLSPERFIEVQNGRVETRPIKGTRPRGSSPQQDQALAEELQRCEKDRAENLMIVDLLRNDLGRSCEPGSIRVPELFSLESYPNVHHLVSSITGRLRSDSDTIDLLMRAFPGGSITGAPKIRAMQIIEELEPVRRSLYCGSVGYLGCEGQMDFNIAIRSLVCHEGSIYCWGGGGVVADSELDAEYQETLTKVGNLLDALQPGHDSYT
ncbi:aminodeoxychorismate synthase component I [Halopseudomonas aestusnigri]|jgi:para-aminobenzoate synthetase component 1|uniref:aminodeoxychorismate synthase component I n=1 Tax=Halopseudomonas aestusnigri TaxID=857252 RepID=UPI000C97BF2C|nr:aminodeoxychorismate synthase component I [Halopseudomonas aestusnigri]MAK74030.1 aminodeoxychorismate synthase, component I [Pseudomonadales bacterium]HBT56771.1 aminodeoxychorismate synthase component I [Pseudomonas sp.]MCK5532828.1 aminodeoxychorismate synthase component I [Halopseudomonas aestusnigri]UGV32563.1 aminodeoxychorismate synthase component I [Halopseudomonas aestusnigri]HCP02548.1 aminodeoxychorismate synthase component I [Pseudomonas sp.]|tara:strand:+ start:10289 stop:11647 length:1359 start_codon:yes stop_codon:yes gene_type:complete